MTAPRYDDRCPAWKVALVWVGLWLVGVAGVTAVGFGIVWAIDRWT